MGNNKQTKPGSGNKSNKGKAKASAKPVTQPANKYLEQLQQLTMNWPWFLNPFPKPAYDNKNKAKPVNYDDATVKRLAAAYNIKKQDSAYTYGHTYDNAETDCGHYTQAIDRAVGDNKYPNYVPDQVDTLKQYGAFSKNIKDAKVGDDVFFAETIKDTSSTSPRAFHYAHTGIIVGENASAGTDTVLNSTVNNHNPGTIKKTVLDRNTGKVQGWPSANIFAGAGRMPLGGGNNDQANNVDTTLAPALMYGGTTPYSSEYTGPPMAQSFPVYPAAHSAGSGSPAASTKATGGTHPLTAHKANTANEVKHYSSASTSKIPSTSDIQHSAVGGGLQSGGGGNSTPVNINYQPSNTINSHSINSANNIHDQMVAILTSAVADAKIGTDIH